MPVLDSYLFFDGNCAQAMRFYESTIGGKIEMSMTYAQSPEPMPGPAGSESRIMHSSMVIDGRRLMSSDTPPGEPGKGMSGFALSLNYPDKEEARRIFDALAAGGQVQMPFGETFWAEGFGMLTDRFGVPWMVGGGESKEIG
jgi:PhnB protein